MTLAVRVYPDSERVPGGYQERTRAWLTKDEGKSDRNKCEYVRCSPMHHRSPSLTHTSAAHTLLSVCALHLFSHRKKPKADLMIIAVAPPIVPKKRELELLSVLARMRWFRDREEWHLQVQVVNA